ncbi:MAG TPA: hypothetical protein VGY55_23515 [Pirellulales bacterium]|jgi:hypothetical protein|nr:hypothetical protein [Pirellulales bacterium]
MSTEHRTTDPNLPQVLAAMPAQAPSVIALLDEWLRDESGYDEETWPELKAAIDRDRPSARRLFDG